MAEIENPVQLPQRFRLTIRGDDPVVELRGYVDGWAVLQQLCEGLSVHFGTSVMVMASVAEDDYDPFS